MRGEQLEFQNWLTPDEAPLTHTSSIPETDSLDEITLANITEDIRSGLAQLTRAIEENLRVRAALRSRILTYLRENLVVDRGLTAPIENQVLLNLAAFLLKYFAITSVSVTNTMLVAFLILDPEKTAAKLKDI